MVSLHVERSRRIRVQMTPSIAGSRERLGAYVFELPAKPRDGDLCVGKWRCEVPRLHQAVLGEGDGIGREAYEDFVVRVGAWR